MIKPLLALLLCLQFLQVPPALAEALLSQTKTEVQHLLDYVERSGCQFNRNNSWYNSVEARRHLQRKYDYLVKKGLVAKTEDFIERGASQSSMSGRPYQVRCNNGKELSSSQWLAEELTRFRQNEKGK